MQISIIKSNPFNTTVVPTSEKFSKYSNTQKEDVLGNPCIFEFAKAVSSFFPFRLFLTFHNKSICRQLSSQWNDQRGGKCLSGLEQLPKNRLPRAHTVTVPQPHHISNESFNVSCQKPHCIALSSKCIFKHVWQFYSFWNGLRVVFQEMPTSCELVVELQPVMFKFKRLKRQSLLISSALFFDL